VYTFLRYSELLQLEGTMHQAPDRLNTRYSRLRLLFCNPRPFTTGNPSIFTAASIRNHPFPQLQQTTPDSRSSACINMDNRYIKHFLPLESNPAVFNELIHLLGAEDEIAFEDVLTLDDPELIPRPALAVVLVLPHHPGVRGEESRGRSPSRRVPWE
jgi:hypothetical protein